MVRVGQSICAGHSMLCPYHDDGNDKGNGKGRSNATAKAKARR
jgi:hypothetical protein